MRELVRRQGAVARTGPAGLAVLGAPATSTERVSFGAEIVTWDQLPPRTRRAARQRSPLVAEAVHGSGETSVEGGRTVEYATGWRVHEGAVVVAVVARPLVPAAGHGFRPAGPWEHRSVSVAAASEPPRRRRGLVEVASELHRDAVGTRPTVTASPDQSKAAEVWGYLPAQVRAAAERLVPEPTVWLGALIQGTTADGFPEYQDIRMLRMSASRAVVLLASRSIPATPGAGLAFERAQMAAAPWNVEQVGLELGVPGERTLLHAR